MRHHHVNLAVRPGGLEAQHAFLVDVLGYVELEPGPGLVKAGFVPHWYGASDGSQIHISEDADHRPAERAHVAIELSTDELAAVGARLTAAGTEHRVSEGVAGLPPQIIVRDPAGNRWELRGPE